MAELKAYEPTLRDRLARLLMGDAPAASTRGQFVQGLTGSTGLGMTGPGPGGTGLADFLPGGQVLAVDEAARNSDARTFNQDMAMALMPGSAAGRGMVKGEAQALAKKMRTLYHGSNADEIGQFLPSDRGRFGPGVYGTMNEQTANAYGNHLYEFEAPDNLFQAWNRNGRLTEADEMAVLENLPPEARTKVEAMRRWYGTDREAFWEALRRDGGGDDIAQSAIKGAGFDGIEGIGDGHEAVIFDPAKIANILKKYGVGSISALPPAIQLQLALQQSGEAPPDSGF